MDAVVEAHEALCKYIPAVKLRRGMRLPDRMLNCTTAQAADYWLRLCDKEQREEIDKGLYIPRLLYGLGNFAAMSEEDQNTLMDLHLKGYRWRGESPEVAEKIAEQAALQRELGPEEYRRRAMATLKKLLGAM